MGKTSKSAANWKQRVKLEALQVVQLRAETMLDERTIRAWAAGSPKLRHSTMAVLARAARKLGIQVSEAAA